MSQSKKFIMTYEGVKKLEEELEDSKKKRNYRKNKSCFRIWGFK